MNKSEFGKGLVICLVKFAEHRWRWQEQKRLREEMHREYPNHFTMASAVESHFNGASDHLCEIEVPREWAKKKIAKKVQELQQFGLTMGHGVTHRNWIEADVDKAYNLCQEIALLLDKELGLTPQIGDW